MFVGLDLIPSTPDGGIFISCVLEFNHTERQAVDKDNNIGAAVVLPFDDGELIDDQPVVIGWMIKVNQTYPVARNRTVIALILNLDAISQHTVKCSIGADQRGRVWPQDFTQGFVAGFGWDVRIESINGVPQSSYEYDIAERVPLSGGFAWGNLWAMPNLVAQLVEPRQSGFFDGRFVKWIRHWSFASKEKSCFYSATYDIFTQKGSLASKQKIP